MLGGLRERFCDVACVATQLSNTKFNNRGIAKISNSSRRFPPNCRLPTPSKLKQLRYAGYSAEFLDRVEPNGNIPHKQIEGKRKEVWHLQK